jgi:hypothetical protein
MNQPPAISTVLMIGGHELNTGELTSLIGVEPTEIWHQKHEQVRLTRPDIATIGWVYKLENKRRWCLGEAIDEALDILWNKRDDIAPFLASNHLKVSIRCRPFGDASTLEYIIRPEVIKKLAFFEAEISFAVYRDGLLTLHDQDNEPQLEA